MNGVNRRIQDTSFQYHDPKTNTSQPSEGNPSIFYVQAI